MAESRFRFDALMIRPVVEDERNEKATEPMYPELCPGQAEATPLSQIRTLPLTIGLFSLSDSSLRSPVSTKSG